MTDVSGAESRLATTSLEIDSSPDAVWRALTEPAEVVRWFALSAEVSAGEGGSVVWHWGDVWTWPTRIAIWEPRRHLRLTYVQDAVSGAKALAVDGVPAHPLVIDFHLEAGRSGTRLRLVHSGFGRDSAWDDEFDGVRRGWITELAALKHYLERHAGEDRRTAWAYARVSLPGATAWNRLIGNATDAGPVLRTRTGLLAAVGPKRARLVLQGHEVGSHLIACIPAWGDAQLRLWLDPAGGETLAQVFFAYHGATSGADLPTARELSDVLRRCFPDASEVVAM